MNQIPNIEEWEKEFDKTFVADFGLDIKGWNTTDGPEIKDVKAFIHHQLQKAREEGYGDGYRQGKFDAQMDSELDQEVNSNKTVSTVLLKEKAIN